MSTLTKTFVLVLLLLVSTTSRAATVSECQALIAIVGMELDGVEIAGGNPDRTRASLESKLDGAAVKLDQAKFGDAIQKLSDFENKVLRLGDSSKPKMKEEDSRSLAMGAADAAACVQALIDQP